ncbi:DUF262 domain-containing protein [Chryseobacterium balustinum]|uniref:GmrSD restriction endonucleases N-terminal domain-containing protein n=1 Tax=Chryseobacterium balustinum TaxID=246 RepID=A0ABY1LBW3_9FLAO|nr:DUF262 domain-containing protein [Chryseobacterium balustinum]SKB94340.1 Protein of unknown function DUF262 [Chryseobacterium balustinum]
MSNHISIKSIKELSEYNFFIPSYQRGYRWTERQTTDLLEDILEFINEKDKALDGWYCLQPVVVKKNLKTDDKNLLEDLKKVLHFETDEQAYSETKKILDEYDHYKYWEVIDGQQRLTTLFLILNYLKDDNENHYSINYETRDDSRKFLEGIRGKTFEESEENIDYYHIFNSYSTVKNWFKEKSDIKNIFLDTLLKKVKVIWFEASGDSIDIFTRINSGKIPLTNAELIKALFLNSSNFKTVEGQVDAVKLRLKQLEIASEWDRIEYALQNDSFWLFVNKAENKLATRIEFIFDLIFTIAHEKDNEALERKRLNIRSEDQIRERKTNGYLTISEKFGNDDYSTFRFFAEKFKTAEQNTIEENWKQVKNYFQILEEWYNDRELYHKVGYLVTIGVSLRTLLNIKESESKSKFLNLLNNKISEKLEKIDFEKLEYNGYFIREILLLHNIQTMLNNTDESSRFPFDRFKKEFWDVEHIHAIATEVKVKKEDQVSWLQNNFRKGHDEEQNESLAKFSESVDDYSFQKIIDYILGEEDNSISNLCLLDRGTNRSYKNDGFKEKRRKLIEREIQGTFIPICTKNTFMKYYSSNVSDLELWNENDKMAYSEKIKEVIKQYSTKLEKVGNEQ